VRATWAPRGQTPVLHHHFAWTRMSMSAALAYRPDRSEAALVFQMKEGAYDTDSMSEFLEGSIPAFPYTQSGIGVRNRSERVYQNSRSAHLEEFHTHFSGEKVTLIWDGLPSHRSKKMKAWIATQRSWLVVEQLPGYAHDLNPVELVWGNVKAVELANLCPDTIDEAHTAAETGLERVGTSYQLCFNFLDHTGLSL